MSATVTATFVFTDLVDSTATAARLGPEAAEELRRTHFRLLRSAVVASGGTEVKNLGDGLMVMYTSPSRAVVGAVGMQQAIEHHNRSTDEPLGVRIGISAGEAVEEDEDYFGTPVVEAARLCAAAGGGRILATNVVRALVGRHATQMFLDVGAMELKGIPEPVDAVEVLWEPAQIEGPVPLPGRLVGAMANALFGFFGRRAELEALVDAGKRARASRRCEAVFVAGEAGIGKTSLVAQAARQAHSDGTIVLFGHADEDLGVAYQPWIEALGVLARDFDADLLGALRVAQRAALSRLIPEVDPGGDGEGRVADPDTERLLLMESVVELLSAASRRAPVMLVLDDVHWIDKASIQLLRHVIASATAMDVTIVGTYRDTDLGRSDPLTKLLADLHREANVTRLALVGLDDREVIELITAAAGHDLDDNGIGLAHALRRETEGNPFFTGEMLRHLGETDGIILGDDGRWRLAGGLEELGLPSSVRDVVGRRVARLGADALRVLSIAAVIGREFDLHLLSGLVDLDDDPLLDLMDAAVGAAVLMEGDVADRYRFAHALIRHTLYDELSPTRRQRAHERIAETLEAQATSNDPAVLAELATHWIAATRPTDLDKALLYARRAGDAARDALAPDDAIRWYQQALKLIDRHPTPDEHQRAELVAALGGAQRQAGDPEYHDTLLRAAALAKDIDDVGVLVQVALGFHLFAGSIGNDAAKPVIQAALDRITRDVAPTRARLLAALAAAHDATLEWQTRRELFLEAIDIARPSGDEAAFVEVVESSQVALNTPDRREQCIDVYERAVAMADRMGDPVLRVQSRWQLLWARYQEADLAAVDVLLAEMEALTEGVGLPYQRWLVTLGSAGRMLLAGQADDAETANEHALQLGTAAGSGEALGAFGGVLYLIRRHQGRSAEIADFLVDVARDNPSIAGLRAVVPLMLCEIGRTDEARELLTAEASAGFEFPYDSSWLIGMCILTDAAATLRDESVARTLVDRLAPYATHVICSSPPSITGATARPLARAATILRDYDQATEWFAIAHDIHTRLQAPYYTALGQLDHADLCLIRRADGDLERARELVMTAAATAAKYGCAGLTNRAAALRADL